MNKTALFSYFNTALRWNAAFYGFYKITSAGLTFFLFKFLPSSWFSCWATGNSLIFLFLLWIDCGFKKSIPRFCPLYLGINYHRQFITKVIVLRCAALLMSTPVVWFCMKSWWGHPESVHWIMFLFFSQGMATIFELLYHAHFWQREYAIMQTGSLLFEIACNLILLSTTEGNMNVVQGLFINKAMSSVILIIFSSLLLPTLYKKTTLVCVQNKEEKKQLKRSFIRYSLFMWWSTTIKSLSERNFLVPFFTVVLGPPIANTFKVANDAALIFQRTVLRTIGIADMSLLSYAMLNDTPQQLIQAFTHLMRTLILLIFPLATATILLIKRFHTLATNELVFLFGIIISGYMLEMLLSPYERLLEVQFKFRELFKAYLPYVVGYALLLFIVMYHALINLVIFMFVTQALRLLSSLLMCWYEYDFQNNPFPKALLYKVAGICLFVIGATWYFL